MQKPILLVEDDLELSAMFTTFLKSKGLKVDVFSNADRALLHFRASLILYSIIITDFRMEGMNGIEFAKEVRRLKGNSIVIIMITAFSIYEIVDKEEVVNVVDRVIMKPFSLKSLYIILSNYLE